MKVAIVIPGGVGRDGVRGVVPCLLWHIERLVRDGDEVHVFALYQEPAPGRWRLNSATIHNAGRKRPLLHAFAQLIAEHRRSPFQIVHTAWSPRAHLIAAIAGKVLDVPVMLYFGAEELVGIPDIGYGAQLSRTTRTMLRMAVACAGQVATQSAYMVELAREQNIHAERLSFGVALDRWPPLSPRRRAAGAPAKLLHVGAIIGVKDHLMLLDAAALLKTMDVDFELDVVGEDIAGDGAMQRRAEELGLSDRVRFHGFLPHSATRPHFENADLLVVTSRHEAGPLVALEAAVAGVPTVGTNVGHLAEWAPHAARVVEPRDSAALAGAIAHLLDFEDERLLLAARAQQIALVEDADATSARFRVAYEELFRRSRKARRPGLRRHRDCAT
jgi:glycosyltransferase involved in cell wall biosynthesis